MKGSLLAHCTITLGLELHSKNSIEDIHFYVQGKHV